MANEKALTIDSTKHVISNINDDAVLLVKAVQELSAQVKELQAQLDALKGT